MTWLSNAEKPNCQTEPKSIVASFAFLALVIGVVPAADAAKQASMNSIVASDSVVPNAYSTNATLPAYSPSYSGIGDVSRTSALQLPDLRGISVDGSARSIIGADNRVRVAPTTAYPARAVALMTTSTGRCTAWMIGPDTAMTAGHCVFSGGRWASNVKVYPGYTGTSAPFGFCSARRLYSVVGWTAYRHPDYDYGAIKLNCKVGNRVGWFGFRWQSAPLTNQPAITQGYPGDKPFTQWLSRDIVRVSLARKIFYANDTTGGQSGSPVYNNLANCAPCGIAIHTNGVGLYGRPFNSGTRIVQGVFQNMIAWRNAP